MKFVRILFGLAAAWGGLVLVPGLFAEAGPRPEYYYGFVGLALVFQLVFVMIAVDPVRYRALIPIAILEKLAFFLPVSILYLQGRVAVGGVFYGAMVDGLLAILFVLAWIRSRTVDQAA